MVSVSMSVLHGACTLPPSKSHTMRAILWASMASGESEVVQPLESPDRQAMVGAMRLFGAEICEQPDRLTICGVGGRLQLPPDIIQCGNSGQVLRFVSALAGLIEGYTFFTGDASLRTNRPMAPLLCGLNQLGAEAFSSRGNGYAPLAIRGKIRGGVATLSGEDSQPVSALLMAAAFAEAPVELRVIDPGEKPWIDMTLAWMTWRGIPFQREGYERYWIAGGAHVAPFSYRVPADWSAAAFPLVAALITGSTLTVEGIDCSDVQGDRKLFTYLEQMGARLVYGERSCHILGGGSLRGQEIDVNDCIDAVPILAVVGCFAEGETRLVNAKIARHKESDRLRVISHELRQMGADIEEGIDFLHIRPAQLKGAEVNAHQDHRIAMALSVAALGAQGSTRVHGTSCIAKSYPRFFETLRHLGANVC